MMSEHEDQSTRTPVDFCHFALACLGFFIAAGGVVVSSVGTALFGLFLLAVGMAYFFVPEE